MYVTQCSLAARVLLAYPVQLPQERISMLCVFSHLGKTSASLMRECLVQLDIYLPLDIHRECNSPLFTEFIPENTDADTTNAFQNHWFIGQATVTLIIREVQI